MPIYEFFCSRCNIVFNFYSSRVNTNKIPKCPECKEVSLERMMSKFVAFKKRNKEDDIEDLPFDETKMENAMQMLEKEAGKINEDDPRQAAAFLRKMMDAGGGEPGDGMEEALRRLEAGEDPEQIEEEMGDLLNPEDMFVSKKKRKGKKIIYDENLYDL